MPDSQSGKPQHQGLSFGSLTDAELNNIHLATLEVLEKTGLYIETEEALEIFDGAGAQIDGDNKIVKIPPQMVEDAIESAPSGILLAGRDPQHDKAGSISQISARESRSSILSPANAGYR
jgi:trimethylamine--corrinoid protein Co-methyltransferase